MSSTCQNNTFVLCLRTRQVILDLFPGSFFFQAEDGIRYLVRSRGLGDVYKRQVQVLAARCQRGRRCTNDQRGGLPHRVPVDVLVRACLLYTSDAADERSSVDLGGRRIINKKKNRVAEIGVNELIKTETIGRTATDG